MKPNTNFFNTLKEYIFHTILGKSLLNSYLAIFLLLQPDECCMFVNVIQGIFGKILTKMFF